MLHEVTEISVEEQDGLQGQYDEAKILESNKLCAMEKAPRLDGFPMSFFLAFFSS